MEKNIIEKYELIDGHIVVDNNFKIITANEEMYRFIGISLAFSIIEIIHQVDLDDFMDVASNLREGKSKDMVIRMRRSDNSYRWMLVHLTRYKHICGDTSFEYLELYASDILAMQKQNNILQNTLQNFRHLLAMENELFFTYDYETGIYQINNFIDNEICNIVEMNIDELRNLLVKEHFVTDDTVDEFIAYCDDIENGTVSYSHTFQTNFITKKGEYDTVEFRGSTIYHKNKPDKAVGNIRNLSESNQNYGSFHTIKYNQNNGLSSYADVDQFCKNNILYNPKCELVLVLMEIDNWSYYEKEFGEEYAERIYMSALQTTKQLVGYRGTVCEIKKNLICIAIRDINTEVYLRSFIESLRNQIAWNIRLMNAHTSITFSIGISRYPQNGTDLGQIHRKLVRALEIAHERGNNRYIIYREHLHGQIQ